MKPAIGHLEAGAGLAGLIKTILTLEAGIIPPNVNFVTANPKLRLEDYNFAIPTEPTLWPTEGFAAHPLILLVTEVNPCCTQYLEIIICYL